MLRYGLSELSGLCGAQTTHENIIKPWNCFSFSKCERLLLIWIHLDSISPKQIKGLGMPANSGTYWTYWNETLIAGDIKLSHLLSSNFSEV